MTPSAGRRDQEDREPRPLVVDAHRLADRLVLLLRRAQQQPEALAVHEPVRRERREQQQEAGEVAEPLTGGREPDVVGDEPAAAGQRSLRLGADPAAPAARRRGRSPTRRASAGRSTCRPCAAPGIAMITPTSRPATAPTGNISGHGRSWLIDQPAGRVGGDAGDREAREREDARRAHDQHPHQVDRGVDRERRRDREDLVRAGDQRDQPASAPGRRATTAAPCA